MKTKQYKINITNSDCEILDIIEIDTTELNWDSSITATFLGQDIIKEIQKDLDSS